MEKKLLKRIEEMGDGEREKLRELLKDSKGDEASVKLNWMYKDKADSEEYLLGRRIDKTMVVEEETPATAVPGALFSEVINRRSELDMQVKMREDPLYMIRKREEDAKRKLLENPVKMKQLQKLVNEKKQLRKEKKKKKKSKKHKKSSDDSDDDDDLLRKYLSIVEQKKANSLLANNSVAGESGGGKSNHSENNRSSETGDSHGKRQSDSRNDRKRLNSGTEDIGRTVGKKRQYGDHRHFSSSGPSDHRVNNTASPSEESDHYDKSLVSTHGQYSRPSNHRDKRHASPSGQKDHRDKRHASRTGHHSKKKRNESKDSDEEQRSRSRSPQSCKPQGYGLLIRRGGETYAAPVRVGSAVPPDSKSSPVPTTKQQAQPAAVSKEKKRKLTAEEKEQKLAAMMANARDRDEQRNRNIQKYRTEDEREKKKMNEQLETHDADFVKPLVMKHASQSSVEDRIKRNVYNIQRTHADLDRNFARH